MPEILTLETRLLGLVRQINRLLIDERREGELFPKVCQAIVEQAGFVFAWVGYRDRLDDCRMVVMGQAGQMAPHDRHIFPPPGGAAERALTGGRTAWNGETTGGELALPLSPGNGTTGVVVIGFAAEVQPTPDTVSLLEGLTALMVHTITDRKAEVELRHAQRVSGVFLRKFESSLLATVQAMATALEKRDPYTAGHQRRVAALSMAIGREIGLPRHRLQGLHIGALIHDIGKIQVPAEILAKPGFLRLEEMNLIRIHPTIGLEMVQDIGFPWPVGSMIVQHHERLDGSGYPDGLSGDDIILESRIIAVADVVEAMAAHRPYRPALGIETALDEIRAHRGQYYDAAAVDLCCELFAHHGEKILFEGESDTPSPVDDPVTETGDHSPGADAP